MRKKAGVGPTQIAGPETIHIANILEQVVCGYLCESNSAQWSRQLFNYKHSTSTKNVITFFYRFEFQQRGTLHLIVWLKKLDYSQFRRLHADIPSSDNGLAFLVNKLQKSDKKSPCLSLQ